MHATRAVAVVSAAIILLSSAVTLGHSPNIDCAEGFDTCLADWCLDSFDLRRYPAVNNVENVSTLSDCLAGGEDVWFDAPGDGAVNDLATVATTQDANNLYWAAELWVDPDPNLLPHAQIAIDVVPGGGTVWHDPLGALATAGTCANDTSRRCTVDEDCAFCGVSTIYGGTDIEQPRTCGSALGITCSDEPGDACDGSLTTVAGRCVGAGGTLAPNVGSFSSRVDQADYLLIFDFNRWVLSPIFVCDSVELRRWDAGSSSWVTIPSGGADECSTGFWRFVPAVNPGASGSSAGPPGAVELAIPWSVFSCAGCPTFEPDDDFKWTLMIAREAVGGSTYAPDGAIEDVMTESSAGVYTNTTNSCPGAPGVKTTSCEITDGSADAYVNPVLATAGGEITNLLADRTAGGVSLAWDLSCSLGDTQYGVYEGSLPIAGGAYDHTRVTGQCDIVGATTSFASAGSSYYLVVPNDDSTEGGYGSPTTGTRSTGIVQCETQSLGNCP